MKGLNDGKTSSYHHNYFVMRFECLPLPIFNGVIRKDGLNEYITYTSRLSKDIGRWCGFIDNVTIGIL